MSGYTIRPARADDSRFIYELSRDPRIRAMSTRSDEFTFEDHERWYAEKRSNGLTAMWIMEAPHGVPVGQVRYGKVLLPGYPGTGIDWVTRTAEIAISIVPLHWRKGHALRLLQGTMLLACEWLKVDTLVALVLRENGPSRNLFRRAGFRYVGVECRMGLAHARYEWRMQ